LRLRDPRFLIPDRFGRLFRHDDGIHTDLDQRRGEIGDVNVFKAGKTLIPPDLIMVWWARQVSNLRPSACKQLCRLRCADLRFYPESATEKSKVTGCLMAPTVGSSEGNSIGPHCRLAMDPRFRRRRVSAETEQR